MIAVFKTNVVTKRDARLLVSKLRKHYPEGHINFDLQDCDKILRVDAVTCFPHSIVRIVNEHGFSCSELE